MFKPNRLSFKFILAVALLLLPIKVHAQSFTIDGEFLTKTPDGIAIFSVLGSENFSTLGCVCQFPQCQTLVPGVNFEIVVSNAGYDPSWENADQFESILFGLCQLQEL